ncbi:uncharacterized protein EV420DRAFT_1599305 [Desarmillaria tabescens]|uniref:Uncharacterized protein n=1 Tax=Armillaria tabescens TaxID=1929756 RepID=A0AA39MG45_ARMTA|nr:uncharacterized protein EV420DRAFT_1599305 [Desarmillaria tabescens]KAK0433591.1 hypothetical protein EV420DRAFT_1599305 [Desarmillaria tabescens]
MGTADYLNIARGYISFKCNEHSTYSLPNVLPRSLEFTSQFFSLNMHAVILTEITRMSCVIVHPETIFGSNSMLAFIFLPSLNHLSISYKGNHSHTASANDDVVPMLQRSNCVLKTLKLSMGQMISDPLHLLQCDSSSSLEEIAIFSFPVDLIRDILSRPYAINDTAFFLPKLRYIEIDVSSPSLSAGEYESLENCIMPFLESREAGGVVLESFYVHAQMEYVMSESFERCLRFYICRYDHNDPQPF